MPPYDRSMAAPGVGFEFRVLGPLEVLYDGNPVPVGGSGLRSLLACLLFEPNVVVPIERLIDTIWGETPPATARTIIHGYISRLRKLFAQRASGDGDPEIITWAPGYLFRVDADRIDEHRARAMINRAKGLEPEERARLLAEAVSLWRGPVLADVPSARLHRSYAQNLTDLRLIVLEERIDADLELGRHHQLLVELSTLVDHHPLREKLTAQLMLANYRAGHRAEAQARYHTIRRLLSQDLGIDPGPELRDLYERLLRDDESLRGTRRPGAPRTGPAPRPTPAELPPAVVGFVGRDRELNILDEMLSDREEGVPQVAVVTGTAGVGKTALAVTWARQVASRYPDGQLYVSLRGFDPERRPLSAGDALTGVLQALGIAAEAIPGEVDDRAALYRSVLADRRVLVVLDNARDSEQVRPLLPGGSESFVLVTSRRRLDGLMVRSGARLLPVEILSTSESIELLDRAGGPGVVAAEPAAARRLAELCGGLPLALRIAAARLAANPGREVADLVHELSDDRNRLQVLDIGDSDTSVRRAFELSYRSLLPDHAATFRLLALIPGPTFTEHAVAALCGIHESAARSRLSALTLAHLITEPVPGRFGFHDLLRLYARERLADARHGDDDAFRRLLDYYMAVSDQARRFLRPARDDLDFSVAEVRRPRIADRAEALAWFDAEWPNLVAAFRSASAAGMHDRVWRFARLQFNYVMVRCPWDDWIEIFTDGLRAAEIVDDPTGKVLMTAGLGVAYARSGRPAEAHTHYAESYRGALSSGDPGWLAMAQVNMGSVLMRLGRYRDAEVHCHNALRTYRSLGDRYREAGALNNLAQVEQFNGRHEEALAHLREAEVMYREADDLEGLAVVLNNCGEVSSELHRLEDAERYHHEALDVAQRCGSAIRQAAAYLGLGDAANLRGDRAVARTRWETALTIFETGGSPQAAEARKRLSAATA